MLETTCGIVDVKRVSWETLGVVVVSVYLDIGDV